MPDFQTMVDLPAGSRVVVRHGLGVNPESVEAIQVPDYDPPVMAYEQDEEYFYIQSTDMNVSIRVQLKAWRVAE